MADELTWLLQSELILPRGLSTIVKQFVEISISVRAALQATSSFNRLTSLNRALAEVSDLRRMLVFSERSLNLTFAIATEQWYLRINEEVVRISKASDFWAEIPNPYIIGNPLFPTSHQVFVGRERTFELMQSHLEKPYQRAALALYGERRSGKTSILLQLPLRLDIKFIPVFVDLQGLANVNSEISFLYGLAKAITRGAANTRSIDLPKPIRIEYEFDPYLAFNEWLDQIEEKLGDGLIVLCLDEFEKLAEQIKTEKFTLQLLDLLRNIIQFRASLVIIISGVQVNDYMQGEWATYFINAVPIEVGVLDEFEARQLITNPIPDFPLDYSVSAVDLILASTFCHPFLVQLVCHEVVKQQNYSHNKTVSPETVAKAVRSALATGDFYFRDKWNNFSDYEQKILLATVHDQVQTSHLEDIPLGDITQISNAITKLVRQKILYKNNDDSSIMFNAEMFRQWIASNY